MFGGLAFGQYWPQQQAVVADTPRRGGGGKPEKPRKKQEEPDIWPQPWMAPHVPPKQPDPAFTVPVEALALSTVSPPAEAVPPSPEAIDALSGILAPPAPRRSVVWLDDPEIAARAEALRLHLRRELEDEEILWVMGFFD